MLDNKKIKDAMNVGLSFVCAACTRWHDGVEKGVKDHEGDQMCTHFRVCFGPMSGGSFDYYNGPLSTSLVRFCYVCGNEADKAIEPQVPNGKRIGCCSSCFNTVVLKQARDKRANGCPITFTSDPGQNRVEG